MSSLNQAFIKAYGRDTATEPAPPPAATQTPPVSQVVGNWYSADTWYRAESAQPPTAPVNPPHVTFPPTYQAPTSSDLTGLPVRAAASVESEYRLSPELLVEEDRAIAAAAAASVSPLMRRPLAVAPAPAVAAPVVAKPNPNTTQATLPTIVAPDFDKLFAPMQVTTAWDTGFEFLPPMTTVGPVPVVPPAPPSVAAPRLDPAAVAPVPKPHTHFAPATAPPEVKSPAPVVAPLPPVVEAAPLGLLQPAWEVDRFQWPDHCRQLLSTQNEYLADVGTRLSQAARDGLSILAITSTRRGEGRTTLALCLARAAADAGVKVALVDADIENPQLINELGVEASCGWHDVILGKQPLAEAAIVSVEDKFAFFPWTSSGEVKSLNDPRATRVLRAISKAYSLVILDLGPVPGRETRLFEDGENCPVDAAILVRDLRWTSAIEAQRVAAQLTTAGVESVGIAENFGPRSQAAA